MWRLRKQGGANGNVTYLQHRHPGACCPSRARPQQSIPQLQTHLRKYKFKLVNYILFKSHKLAGSSQVRIHIIKKLSLILYNKGYEVLLILKFIQLFFFNIDMYTRTHF